MKAFHFLAMARHAPEGNRRGSPNSRLVNGVSFSIVAPADVDTVNVNVALFQSVTVPESLTSAPCSVTPRSSDSAPVPATQPPTKRASAAPTAIVLVFEITSKLLVDGETPRLVCPTTAAARLPHCGRRSYGIRHCRPRSLLRAR